MYWLLFKFKVISILELGDSLGQGNQLVKLAKCALFGIMYKHGFVELQTMQTLIRLLHQDGAVWSGSALFT